MVHLLTNNDLFDGNENLANGMRFYCQFGELFGNDLTYLFYLFIGH